MIDLFGKNTSTHNFMVETKPDEVKPYKILDSKLSYMVEQLLAVVLKREAQFACYMAVPIKEEIRKPTEGQYSFHILK